MKGGRLMSLIARLKVRDRAEEFIHHIIEVDFGQDLGLKALYSQMGGDGTEPENVLRAFLQIFMFITDSNPMISFWVDQLSTELTVLTS